MKKIIYFTLAFLTIGLFGIQNVHADAESLVNDQTEFLSALGDSNVDVVKLNSDFTYDNSLEYNISSSNYTKTIDLNGYTLSSTSRMFFKVSSSTDYDNFAFTITDSSDDKKGKIASTTTENIITIWVYKLTNKFTFKIDGGGYEASNSSGRFFFFANGTSDNSPTLDVAVNNTKIVGKYSLISTQSFDSNKINLNFNNIEYTKAPESFSGVRLVSETGTQFSSLFDSTKNNLYLDDLLCSDLNTDASNSVANSIKIKSKIQLTLDEVTMAKQEYGYTPISYDLNLKNHFDTAIELKSITLSPDTAFDIVGDMPLTIAGNSSNNSLKIKAKPGLHPGTYPVDITVTDGDDIEHKFGPIMFVVTKASFTPTISMANWTYGETASAPSISGNPSNGTVEYSYMDGTGTWTTTKPTKPGEYELKVVISEGTDHQAYTGTTSFTINKKQLTVSDVEIANKKYNYTEPSLSVEQVSYFINVEDVTHVSYITPKSGSGLYVGSGIAKVYITIKDENDYSEYYYFAGDNTIQTIIEVGYVIEPTNINFTLTYSGSDNETDTPVATKQNSNLDLSSLFDLDEASFKSRVTYSLLGTYTGVSISGKNLIIADNADLQTIGVKLTFSAYDIDDDGTVEYFEKTQDIYIEIADKATPTYTLPTGLIGVKNETLATVDLPTGFQWKDSTIVMDTAGNQTFLATFTPTDTDNYKIVEDIEISIYVQDFFDITTESLGNGTVTGSLSNILEGTTVDIEFTPDLGYMVDEVLLNGTPTTVTDNKLSLEVTENIEIIVSYTKAVFRINVIEFDTDQVSVTPNGVIKVEYGDNQDITIEVQDGYDLVAVKVNSIDKTADLVSNKLILTNITSDYTIEVLVKKIPTVVAPETPEAETPEPEKTEEDSATEKPVVETPPATDAPQEETSVIYDVIEGSDQEVIIKKGKPASFRINADFKLFLDVYINGKLLDPSHYEVSEGSTIVVLKDSYLKTLAKGKYILSVLFKDGGEAKTNFTITKEAEPTKEAEGIKTSTWLIILLVAISSGLILIKRRNKEQAEN